MKILKSSSILALAVLMLASCGSGSEKSGNEAEVSEAQEVKEATGKSLTVDMDATEMQFLGTKPTGRHYGTIGLESGQIMIEDGSITGGKFVFDLNQISVADLKEDPESEAKLVGHLQSDDFFDAANHPKVTFEITEVKDLGNEDGGSYDNFMANMVQPGEDERIMELPEFKIDNPTHEITGNLTMRGNTKAITVPVVVNMNDGKVEAVSNFSIDRTDWGLMYGDEANVVDKAKDKFIYNTVGIGFKVAAK